NNPYFYTNSISSTWLAIADRLLATAEELAHATVERVVPARAAENKQIPFSDEGYHSAE
ncbi:unnamed protein product, partial [Fusarium graminearum]